MTTPLPDSNILQSSTTPSLSQGHSSNESQSLKEMSEESHLKELCIQESIFQDEIFDAIQENSPDLINQSIELMNSCITKIEKLRMQYRSIHKEMKSMIEPKTYEMHHHEPYKLVTNKVVEYIQSLNICIKDHHVSSVASSDQISQSKAELVIQEIERSLTHLKATSTCTISLLSNEDLKQRKSLLEPQDKDLKVISNQLKELICLRPKMEIYTTV